jgi:hypothetical protein
VILGGLDGVLAHGSGGTPLGDSVGSPGGPLTKSQESAKVFSRAADKLLVT